MANYYFAVENPLVLWLLFAVPLLLFTHLYFMRHARHKAILFGNFSTIERVSGKRILTKNLSLLLIRLVIVCSLIFAAAGTTFWHIGERSSNDVVLVIDASASMATADMNGPRIDAAKSAALQFVDTLNAASAIGVVQYSGLPEVLLVPSEKPSEVRAAVNSVALKPVGGSDIAAAILTGTNLLVDKPNGRAIILLTDGVASLSLYEDNPIPQAISYARQRGVVIHTIGIGTDKLGSFVPGLAAEATLFDEENLRRIATDTGGSYAWARNDEELAAAFERVVGERTTAYVPIDLSSVLLFVALGLIFVEWGLLNTRFRLLP